MLYRYYKIDFSICPFPQAQRCGDVSGGLHVFALAHLTVRLTSAMQQAGKSAFKRKKLQTKNTKYWYAILSHTGSTQGQGFTSKHGEQKEVMYKYAWYS